MPAPLSLAALIGRSLKPAPRPAIVAGYAKPDASNPTKLVEISAELREAGAATIHTGTLDACLTALQAGDTLAVTTPDHLARSPRALLALEAKLSGRGVSLLVLRLGAVRLDTREPGAGLILAALEGVSLWGRETQRVGIATAQAEGRLAGKAATIDREAVLAAAAAHGPAKAARTLGVARSTVYRVLRAA